MSVTSVYATPLLCSALYPFPCFAARFRLKSLTSLSFYGLKFFFLSFVLFLFRFVQCIAQLSFFLPHNGQWQATPPAGSNPLLHLLPSNRLLFAAGSQTLVLSEPLPFALFDAVSAVTPVQADGAKAQAAPFAAQIAEAALRQMWRRCATDQTPSAPTLHLSDSDSSAASAASPALEAAHIGLRVTCALKCPIVKPRRMRLIEFAM